MTDANYVRSYGKPVMMGHNLYFGNDSRYINTSGDAVLNSINNATDITTNNLNVANNLHATHFDLQTVAQLGGSFYVSPTVKFPNSGTTLGVTKSGTTLTLTITDSSITSTTMAGIVWSANSRVKVSGTINGVVTGTMDGTVSSINTSSHVLTLSVSGENSGSVAAGTYSASQFSDLSVMVYQRRVVDGSTNNDYRVGIWMNCYDIANSSATIRVYGGTSSAPNVLLGNLTNAGLGTVNGITPSGWGLYAQNAFLWGAVVSTEGQIGGFTIGENTLSNGTFASSGGVFMSTGYTATSSQKIGGSAGSLTWAYTAGNTFGVTTAGAIYATSGKIGGFSIDSNSFNAGGSYGTSGSVLVCTGTAGKASIAGSGSIDGWAFTAGSKYGVTNMGVVYGSDVHLTGEITATSGTIGGASITNGVLKIAAANITGTLTASQIGAGAVTADKLAASAITVGGRNLVRGSRTMVIGTGNHATGTFRGSGSNGTMETVTYTDTETPVAGVTNGIKITCTTASNYYGFAQDGAKIKAGTVTYSIWLKASEACDVKIQPWWSNTSGVAESFGETVSVTTSWARYTLTGTLSYDHPEGLSISYIYMMNSKVGLILYTCAPMMEYGNFPSDWSPSPDEIGGFTIDPTSIHTSNVAVTSNADNSIALSSSDFTRTINGTSRAGLRFAMGDKFGVTGDGAIYASSADITGVITANTGYIGGTSGWTIASQQLSNGSLAASNSMVLATKDLGSNTSIAGRAGSDWRFAIDSNFGITKTGAVYASTLVIGPSNGYHATIADSAFKVYNNTTLLSSFGTTTQIGASTANNFKITTTGIQMNALVSGSTPIEVFYVGVDSRTANAGTESNPDATETTTLPYYILGESGYTSTVKPGAYSFAVGKQAKASGSSSIAMGFGSVASKTSAISIGPSNATGVGSIAIGTSTSSAYYSYAIGNQCQSTSDHAFSLGFASIASATSSYAFGYRAKTTSSYTTALGKYNDPGNYALMVGKGTSNEARSNALTLDWNGNLWIAGGMAPSRVATGSDATVGNLDPLTSALIGSAASNKSFGLPAAAIKIEYSTNGGSTWTDYGATDAEKKNLFSETRGTSFYLGKATAKASNNVNNRLRVTIEPTDRYVTFHGIYVWWSTQGNTCVMDLERSTIGSKDTFTTVFTGQSLSGWSGNNIRYFPQGTFGGGSTQTSNNYKYRITFRMTAINSNYPSAIVNDIRFIGSNVWTSPNYMVEKNRLYTWDNNLNVTFPASVSASTFSGQIFAPGQNIVLGTTSSSSNNSGMLAWAYGNGTEKMSIWAPENITETTAPYIRMRNSSGTILYNGTLVLADGTGASGSWGISITGSSASCTGNAANVTGTVAVDHGGTGATSFTANSVIMSGSSTTAALTTRSITNNTSASTITASTNIITANTLAYWNGAYSGTTSRLAYCNQGAFGTMATKSASDYAALTGAAFTGDVTIGGKTVPTYSYAASNVAGSGNTKITLSGGAGTIQAHRIGNALIISVNMTSFTLSSTYTWTNIATISLSDLGITTAVDANTDFAFISGGGPAYSDQRAVLSTTGASAGATTLTLRTQVQAAVSAKYFIGSIVCHIN